MDEGVSEARRRALRAARVVAFGTALGAAPLSGCYQSHVREPAAVVDAGTDGGMCDPNGPWEDFSACCDRIMWDFHRGCTAWGPFVPPSDGEVG